jgi:hypothetical protein
MTNSDLFISYDVNKTHTQTKERHLKELQQTSDNSMEKISGKDHVMNQGRLLPSSIIYGLKSIWNVAQPRNHS